MVTNTSGTTAFTMDVDDIIEQALDPLGGEHTSGIDALKARRVLNLILIQMQNKNIPLNKLDFAEQVLNPTEASYILDASISDVLKCSISYLNTGVPTDLPIQRYSLKEYQDIPNKEQSQRPNTFTTQRFNNAVTLTFWPVPDNLTTYTAKMLVSKRIEDITASYQKVDLPYRYLPLLIKWLTYDLSVSKQGIPEDLRQRLEKDYKEYLPDTFEEDRERTDFVVRPGGLSVRGY